MAIQYTDLGKINASLVGYRVSMLGRFYSPRGNRLKCAQGRVNVRGVNLSVGGVLAKCFLGMKGDRIAVRKRGNNFSLGNLEMMSRESWGRWVGTNYGGRSTNLVGTNNPLSKLNVSKAREIYKLREQGWSLKDLADAYGVSDVSIHKVCSGETWSYATGATKKLKG